MPAHVDICLRKAQVTNSHQQRYIISRVVARLSIDTGCQLPGAEIFDHAYDRLIERLLTEPLKVEGRRIRSTDPNFLELLCEYFAPSVEAVFATTLHEAEDCPYQHIPVAALTVT